MPDRVAAARCGQCGRSSTLHGYGAPFSVVSLPTEPVGCEELTKGEGRGGLWSRACGSKVQGSTFGDGGGTLQGSALDKVGPNGCGARCRTPTSG
jgi:hypothetical protein